MTYSDDVTAALAEQTKKLIAIEQACRANGWNPEQPDHADLAHWLTQELGTGSAAKSLVDGFCAEISEVKSVVDPHGYDPAVHESLAAWLRTQLDDSPNAGMLAEKALAQNALLEGSLADARAEAASWRTTAERAQASFGVLTDELRDVKAERDQLREQLEVSRAALRARQNGVD